MNWLDWLIVPLFGFAAGFVDAVAGGGGLIQLPALLAFFPQYSIPQMLGTNKLAGFSGTLMAATRYAKKTPMNYRMLLPAIIGAFVFSFLGAYLVSFANKAMLEPIIIGLLIIILVYTITLKAKNIKPKKWFKYAIVPYFSFVLGSVLGLYDGFFGPGTGSFLMMALIAFAGMNFLESSGHAKLINVATNVAALIYFIPNGFVVYTIAIPLAIANVAGAWLGSHLAIKNGDKFIKPLYVLVVSALIVKMIFNLEIFS
ncbi:MAG: TSUP family transporter [Bacteroidales bacterium]|nr:TSUP family transporter [Bacteroidales bacterium]